jgi:hypothetical protein
LGIIRRITHGDRVLALDTELVENDVEDIRLRLGAVGVVGC